MGVRSKILIRRPEAFSSELPFDIFRASHLPETSERLHRREFWKIVYVLSGEEIKPVSVQLGITDNRNTEIVGGELKAGDRVVTGENAGSDKKPSSVGMRMF